MIVGLLGIAYAHVGSGEKARRAMAELRELSKRRYVAPISIANIYSSLGDREHAFEWLEKSLEDRSRGMIFMKVDPMFDSLRPDPRFTALLRRMGLAP